MQSTSPGRPAANTADPSRDMANGSALRWRFGRPPSWVSARARRGVRAREGAAVLLTIFLLLVLLAGPGRAQTPPAPDTTITLLEDNDSGQNFIDEDGSGSE